MQNKKCVKSFYGVLKCSKNIERKKASTFFKKKLSSQI